MMLYVFTTYRNNHANIISKRKIITERLKLTVVGENVHSHITDKHFYYMYIYLHTLKKMSTEFSGKKITRRFVFCSAKNLLASGFTSIIDVITTRGYEQL